MGSDKKNININPCNYSISLDKLDLSFKCIKKDGRCGYHKINQKFKLSNLTPNNLCPEAYHNLYYISLGLLFNADFSDEKMILKCSSEKNYVVFKADFEKLNLRFRIFNISPSGY